MRLSYTEIGFVCLILIVWRAGKLVLILFLVLIGKETVFAENYMDI